MKKYGEQSQKKQSTRIENKKMKEKKIHTLIADYVV